MTESKWNKGDEECEGLSFIKDPFTLRRSTSGQIVAAEWMFESQHEQTPERSAPQGLTTSLPPNVSRFNGFNVLSHSSRL
jgi:hypothetical protein